MSQPIVDALNGLIATELVAVNQYFVHAKLCEHWGFEKLAAHFREDSMEEMRDIEAYMDRVLLLGGLPNLQRLDSFQVGESVVEAVSRWQYCPADTGVTYTKPVPLRTEMRP